MKYIIVCVRDRAADVFGVPHFVANLGGAIRAFADEVNRSASDNSFYKHPEDFDLYELGTFDDGPCVFETLAQPRQVAIGKDLQQKGNGHAI